jgi:hypothetical protein
MSEFRFGGWVMRREEDDWETQERLQEEESERYWAEEKARKDAILATITEDEGRTLKVWGGLWNDQHGIVFYSTQCVSTKPAFSMVLS